MKSKEELKALREATGMNRREFAAYFEIPYRTVQDWELGNRQMPDYLLRLMAYKVHMEKMYRRVKEETNEDLELLQRRNGQTEWISL